MKRRIKMKNFFAGILVMALIFFAGANLVLAGTPDTSSLVKYNPQGGSYEVPSKGESDALLVVDYTSWNLY
jgi:hypothetical protein